MGRCSRYGENLAGKYGTCKVTTISYTSSSPLLQRSCRPSIEYIHTLLVRTLYSWSLRQPRGRHELGQTLRHSVEVEVWDLPTHDWLHILTPLSKLDQYDELAHFLEWEIFSRDMHGVQFQDLGRGSVLCPYKGELDAVQGLSDMLWRQGDSQHGV